MQYRFLLSGMLILAAIPFSKSSLLPAAEIYPQNISFHFAKQTIPFWELGKPKDISTDTAALKLSNWYAQAMQGIEEMEYEIKYDEATKTYASPNRRNNLRSFYSASTFTLLHRYDSADKWRLELKTLGVFVNNKHVYSPSNDAVVSLNQKTVQFNHNNDFTIEYINSPEGIRQNFIINKEPVIQNSKAKIQKDEPPTLNLKLQTSSGWFVNKVHDKELHFAKATKNGYDKKITYNSLKVWDANNKELQASFSVQKSIVSIDVNVGNAVFPVTIDPLSTTANWTAESNQADAHFGHAVATAGDVNGDGYSDVIIGASYYTNGQIEEGRTYVYHGSSTGLSITPNWTAEGDQDYVYFGTSVATAGDVNKDGYGDVIIGAHSYNNGETREGRAFVYYGSSTGLSITPNWTAESNQAYALFGFSVASAGDVNGDGYSDVIVGCNYFDNMQSDEGRVYVYYGSSTGLSLIANWTAESNQDEAGFGESVASAGDINGDGYSDVIIGSSGYDNGQINEGRAFLYFGSTSGLSAVANWTTEGDQDYAFYAFSVASAGDVNGDGYSDVIVGAIQYENGQISEGRAYVYYGSSTGLANTANWTFESNVAGANLGWSVSSAGDVNGDGYSDVIIGAYAYNNEGKAFVFNGSASGLAAIHNWTDEGNQTSCLYGFSVGSAGDVNGDGYSDVIVGAWGYDNGQNDEGRAFVYHGSPDGLKTTAIWTTEGNLAYSFFGVSVSSAGDVNGDGYGDVIIGAHQFSNGEAAEGKAYVFHGSATGLSLTPNWTAESNQAFAYFGVNVSCAGDVNGDGYSDIIIGSTGFTNGETNEGRAFVYHGSATGLSLTPNWTAESNQASAGLGVGIKGAGDVNGDGYSDVIVGAPWYDNGNSDEGRVFVYHGSATGLSLTPNWTAESNQDYANMGFTVGSAGDVNGDGYSDVITGAPYYDNGETDEGRTYLYYGSATGLSLTPNWTAESNQASANFGINISSAGDVNGDGFSDIIIGAHFYSNGESNEGRAFVYHGSVSGLSATANWTAESNQANANFGYGVSSAGDVNGDGYSDVIVGAYKYSNGESNEGRAFVYHGSVTGLSVTASWTAESNQADAQFGTHNGVACAGDVNGDGYSDVIASAWSFNNGEEDEGKVFLYYGNANGGLKNNLRLYNTDLTTPIGHLNVTEPNLFGAGLFAKSPLGRVKGKLVWEVKRQGLPFSGNPITNSTTFLDKQPSFTDLGIAGTELKYNVQKVGSKTNKVRVRVEYDKVTAITGQVYGPWRYPAGYTMGAYGMNSIPLPITLISFNGQFINTDDVQLNWITANEINMKSYFVERSTDGINFTAIGELAAKGIGSAREDYSLIDKNVKNNLLYYRLKLKEKSAEISYTKTITLNRSKIVSGFIAPNPIQQGSDVSLTLQSATEKNKIHINIFNSSGQLVFTESKMLQKGKNEIAVSTNKLSKGVYVVNVLGEGVKQSYRLVVQ